jgi:hypothetical protein
MAFAPNQSGAEIHRHSVRRLANACQKIGLRRQTSEERWPCTLRCNERCGRVTNRVMHASIVPPRGH